MQCPFSVEVHAPQGLQSIERELASCQLPLVPHTSGFNGKVILRATHDAEIEWSMDSAVGCCLFASGNIPGPPATAQARLQSLAACLRAAGLPHRILIDHPDGSLITSIEYAWPPHEAL